MTEAWKSNPHYFCEVCRVWMNDNPQARATHERGIKHQENVSKKLRDMRKKADSDKRNEALAAASMSSIEAKARKQYENDLKESSKAREELTGAWAVQEPDEGSGHLYNAQHRYYFDSKTGMYYGGEPAAWTLTPDMPPEALYKPPEESKKLQDSGPADPAGTGPKKLRPGMRVANHPLAKVGGYQMPTIGTIGGAKGVGASDAKPAALTAGKRPREAAGASKAVSKEEQEAIARREAARARVEKRTMAAFGLR